MAQEQPFHDVTLIASADLSASQYAAVVLTGTTAKNIAVAGANVVIVGVLQDKPAAAGRAAQVRTMGITKMLAGASFNANVRLATDASGRGVLATSGQQVVGWALAAAAAANDIVTVLIGYLGLAP